MVSNMKWEEGLVDHMSVLMQLVSENAEEYLEAQRRSRKEWENAFVRVSLASRNQLWITFNRPAVTETVFTEVLSSGAAYGTSTNSNGSNHDIMVLPVLVTKSGGVVSLDGCSVQCCRVLLTAAGLSSVLRAAGNTTSLLVPHSCAAPTQVCERREQLLRYTYTFTE